MDMKEENPFEEKKIAAQWIKSVESEKGGPRDTAIYPMLKEWIEEYRPMSVLDIGSGQGVASVLMKGIKYTGVEPSIALVERAKMLYPGTHFLVGNAYELPCGEGTFDGAFSINVWFHLADPLRALKEVYRILKPKGSFLLISPNPDAYTIWESFYEDIERQGKVISGKVRVPGVTLSRNIFYRHSSLEFDEAFREAHLSLVRKTDIAPIKDGRGFLFRCWLLEK